MTFKEAKKRLKRIAGDAYCSISYSVSVHQNGSECAECKLYIDEIYTAQTWQEAFYKLKNQITMTKADSEEAPE